MLIAPARLGDEAHHEKWPRYAEWIGGFDKLSALPDILEQKVAKLADENVFSLTPISRLIITSRPHSLASRDAS